MTGPTLAPVPGPEIAPHQYLTPPWNSWFNQLWTFITQNLAGGGGVVPLTRNINTALPLTGGGNLSADLNLAINTFTALASGVVPASGGGTTKFLRSDVSWQTAVQSVGLLDGSTVPIYSIGGSPVSTAGTLSFTLNNQAANQVFAGPGSGAAAQPGFRALVAADLPGGFNGFANPSASVGLAAVNGAAATAMRSDAAPALSQAIAPTWTATHIFTPGSGIAARFNQTAEITGNQGLAASYGAAIALTGGEAGSIGRLRFGDGTGWTWALTKRVGSADTDLFKFNDSGDLAITRRLGINGAAPPAQVTGWGTPAGPAVVVTFPATPTLAQCGQAIGQIIKDLKAFGLYGA